MSTMIGLAVLGAVLVQVGIVHRYYHRQKRACSTYPYYRLRDEIAWQMLQDPTSAREKENLYAVLNRIVHHADSFGWEFLSKVIQDVTHAVLEHRQAPNPPPPLELALVDLVLWSARANSLVVRLAMTKTGRIMLLLPVARACYRHYRSRYPERDNTLTRSVETMRRVRRLRTWRDTTMAAAA
jgi:hypothetical protein